MLFKRQSLCRSPRLTGMCQNFRRNLEKSLDLQRGVETRHPQVFPHGPPKRRSCKSPWNHHWPRPPGTKAVTELRSYWYHQNKLLTQEGATAVQGPFIGKYRQITSKFLSLLCLPRNAVYSLGQPIPKCQANSGLCTYFLFFFML